MLIKKYMDTNDVEEIIIVNVLAWRVKVWVTIFDQRQIGHIASWHWFMMKEKEIKKENDNNIKLIINNIITNGIKIFF